MSDADFSFLHSFRDAQPAAPALPAGAFDGAGLVLAGPDGVAQRRWSTLVNPGPGPDGDIEVGPTFVHGLVAADLEGAPRFDDMADLLARDLAGRVVVAHNARFDVGSCLVSRR